MFIDFHTHAFPDTIADMALEKLSYAAGALTKFQNGTLANLSGDLERLGGRAVLLPIATKPSQQNSINNWVASVQSDRIYAFGSVHPDAPDALEELERIRLLGLHGIKFHPEYQNFFVDDERVFPIYRKASSLGLITVFHAGMDIAYAPPCHCTPDRLSRILGQFDGAPVVAAHFGGYMMWDQVIEKLMGLPIYFDTSYSHGHIIKPYAQKIVEMHGADKILFGSDSPWNGIQSELNFLDSLGLCEEQLCMIRYKNAFKLLGTR